MLLGSAEEAHEPQPLVRRHPDTGEEILFLGSHIGAIQRMRDEDAEALPEEPTAHATQDRFVHVHSWRPGDVIIWDNRRTLHRGRPYDGTQRRVMRRITTVGEGPLLRDGRVVHPPSLRADLLGQAAE